MDIAFYRWNETDDVTKTRILRRAETDIADVESLVRPIIEDVRKNGDAALVKYAAQFDRADIRPDAIKATGKDFEEARLSLSEEVREAIIFCAENVKMHHEAQMARVEQSWIEEVRPGVWAGEQVNPVPSAGIYIPRGKGAFPSMTYMLCTAAKVAGVPEIHVVTPPTPDGGTDHASLFAAEICGVKNVYKAGGAQGIAALAYGTKTIPSVKKVVGPGSPYVAAAKRLLSHIIDPGMPAGPSDALILADESADPWNTALDVMNEAEHGADSASLLVTHDETLAQEVRKHLPEIIEALPEPRREYCAKVFQTYGGIVLTGSLEDSIAFANTYAPEHLHLKVAQPDDILPLLRNTGEILIGELTPPVLGNFGIGVNAVLPTGGNAATYSCSSVWDFLKRASIARCDPQGYEVLKDPVLTLADYEGFPGHGDVLRKRKL